MLDWSHAIDGEAAGVMSEYEVIVEDYKLETAVNLGSATLAKARWNQAYSVLSSVLDCLTAA